MSQLPSTQDHLDIVDIVDRYVILKQGACSIIQPSPVNFDLLSEGEQETLINTFAGLLNSITFPIQVLIHTRRTDITEYLTKLDMILNRQSNMFLKDRIASYREYIDRLASRSDILDKNFYVVVPYYDALLGQSSKGFFKANPKINGKAVAARAKDQLDPKIDHIISQIGRLGVGATILEEEDLVELFYTIYNPTISKVEHLSQGAGDYTAPFVEAEKKYETR